MTRNLRTDHLVPRPLGGPKEQNPPQIVPSTTIGSFFGALKWIYFRDPPRGLGYVSEHNV